MIQSVHRSESISRKEAALELAEKIKIYYSDTQVSSVDFTANALYQWAFDLFDSIEDYIDSGNMLEFTVTELWAIQKLAAEISILLSRM